MLKSLIGRYHKPLITIAAVILLFFSFKKEVTEAISNWLIPIFGFKSCVPLDIFFIGLTIYLGAKIYGLLKPRRKVVSDYSFIVSSVILTIYLYYRISNKDFTFTGYFSSPIAYLDSIALYFVGIIGLWIAEVIHKIEVYIEEYKATQLPESQHKVLVADKPIESKDDDYFMMTEQINRLVDYLDEVDVKDSAYSIGLSGKWGSGKSSMFWLIKKQIEEQIKEQKKDYIIVDFIPRISKKPELIQGDFLRALNKQLSGYHTGISRHITDYALSLNLPGDLPAVVNLFFSLFRSQVKEWRESYSSVNNVIKEIDRKIIVFIDDLDRLTGEEVIEVMKIIGTNANFSNVIYVTSYDKQYVNEVLAGYLHIDKCCNFTDKYFNTEIEVPIHTYDKLAEYLKQLLKTAVTNGIIHERTETIDTVIDNCRRHLKTRVYTLRDVKRFYNQFIYDYVYVQNDVVLYDFLLLSLIKYTHKDEFERLHHLEYVEHGSSIYGMENNFWLLKESIAPRKDTPDGSKSVTQDLPQCIDILLALFPTKGAYNTWYSKRAGRIYNVSCFETYFYNFEYNHLYAKDFNSLYGIGLKEACAIIDGWKDKTNDFEDYLLTRDVKYFGSKEGLAHYFGILQYAYYTLNSLNLASAAYTFLRVQDIKEIKDKYEFSDEEYFEWLTNSLKCLSTIDASIAGRYVNSLLTRLCEDPSDEEVFMPIGDLRKLSLAILKDYLEEIDKEDWKPSTAFYLSQVRANTPANLVPEASTLLRDSMMSRPEKYIDALIPILVVGNGSRSVSYNTSFLLKEIYPDPDVFKKVIYDAKVTENVRIASIQGLWQLYEGNDYAPIVTDDVIENNAESVEAWIQKQLEVLNDLKSLDKEIDKINVDWLANRRLNNVDDYLERYKVVGNALIAIQLNISYLEKLKTDVSDSISLVNEYRELAQDLTMDKIQKGDIVMLAPEAFESVKDGLYYSNNLFKVVKKETDEMVQLSGLDDSISIHSLKAVSINRVDDADIYYDPVGMATYVMPGQPIPVHHTDKSYYIDHFDRCKYEEKTFSEILADSIKPQFVHEVQHWLREEFHQDDLKINERIKTDREYTPNMRRGLEFIKENKQFTDVIYANKVGISRQSAKAHIRRFMADGLIKESDDGTGYIYIKDNKK